ncbi:MAG: hypothetical protein AAFZ91_08695 [Pseudomonadota bacterium]
MQATASQVTEFTTTPFNAELFTETPDEEPGDRILMDLTKAADASKRSHILVGRRKRSARRATR